MCHDVEKLKKEHTDITAKVVNREDFETNGFSRSINNCLKEKEFIEDICIYFPVDRYYVPNWFNEENYQKLNYDDDNRFVGKSSQNIIKSNVLLNIKKWIYDLFLSREFQIIPTQQGYCRLDMVNTMANNVMSVLRVVKADNTLGIPKYTYKNPNFPITGNSLNISDLNDVSSGEAMLISIFVSLIKEFDFNHNEFELKDISGICVIDEIDLNLHIKQQREILPNLIKMFPKIQFIITTHSPFFVKGMKEIFENNCDFVNMPEGTIINDIIDFSEIEDAIKLFNVSGDKYIEYTKDLKEQLRRISEENEKVTILTEGKTDASFLLKAYEKLGIQKPNVEIRGLEESTDGQSGDTTLKKILEIQKTLSNKLIAIFDRDNPKILEYLDVETSDVLNVVDKKVYAFAIPIPNQRNSNDKISIEHYFTDEELATEDSNGRRLYQAKEFNEIGISLDENKLCKYLVHNRKKVDDFYILSGSDEKKVTDLSNSKNYSLSKADFCDNVCNDVENFQNFNFENFKLIIDKITEIIALIEE